MPDWAPMPGGGILGLAGVAFCVYSLFRYFKQCRANGRRAGPARAGGRAVKGWTRRELAVRVVLLLAGLCVAHLGVTLFLQSDLGSDPFNVFVQGLFGESPGRPLPP